MASLLPGPSCYQPKPTTGSQTNSPASMASFLWAARFRSLRKASFENSPAHWATTLACALKSLRDQAADWTLNLIFNTRLSAPAHEF
jgi:hypothetical protein